MHLGYGLLGIRSRTARFIRANCLANMVLSHSFSCSFRGNCIALRIYLELLVIKGTRSWFIFSILGVCPFLYHSLFIPVVLLLFVLYTSPYFLSLLDIFQSGFWSPRDKPLDDSLKGLEDRLKATVLSSKANGTVLAYSRAFRKWKQFALDKLDGNAFPAPPFYVALYLQHIIEETHSPSAVDSAFYGLKWAHDVAGIPSPTDDPIVEAVRSASKRILGTRALSRKEPISPTLILDIVKKSDLENPVVLRNVTMYVLSFAGFFRFDDASRIRRSDISLKKASWSAKF